MFTLIPFTQYLLPNGRRKKIVFQATTPEVKEKAEALLKAGAKLEIEILSTGAVYATATVWLPSGESDDINPFGGSDELLANCLTVNGPPLMQAIEEMISQAYEKAVKDGIVSG